MLDDLHHIRSVLWILHETPKIDVKYNFCVILLIMFVFVIKKVLYLTGVSRTQWWNHWDLPTSWRAGKGLAVDSGRSERVRASGACPQTALCRRPILSQWFRSPIRQSDCRIHCWFRRQLPAPSNKASQCKYAVSQARFSSSWKVQSLSTLLHPLLSRRYCCHGCLCELRCARANESRPKITKEIHWLQ